MALWLSAVGVTLWCLLGFKLKMTLKTTWSVVQSKFCSSLLFHLTKFLSTGFFCELQGGKHSSLNLQLNVQQ